MNRMQHAQTCTHKHTAKEVRITLQIYLSSHGSPTYHYTIIHTPQKEMNENENYQHILFQEHEGLYTQRWSYGKRFFTKFNMYVSMLFLHLHFIIVQKLIVCTWRKPSIAIHILALNKHCWYFVDAAQQHRMAMLRPCRRPQKEQCLSWRQCSVNRLIFGCSGSIALTHLSSGVANSSTRKALLHITKA